MSNWNEFSTNLANYGVGITEMPAELIRLLGNVHTIGANKLGMISDATAAERYKNIEEKSKVFEPVRQIAPEYVEWLDAQNAAHVMRSLGSIAGGAIVGAGLANPIVGVNLAKQRPKPSMLDSFKSWIRNNPVKAGAVVGGIKGARGETITEPTVEKLKGE
jgi:hypothetical protein